MLYEYPEGGWGATDDRDGLSAVFSIVGNTWNIPVEAVEMRFPIRIDRYELRADSGGAGSAAADCRPARLPRARRAGRAVVRRQPRARPAVGAVRRRPRGAPAAYTLDPGGAGARAASPEFGAKQSRIPMRRDDVIRQETAGGGGFGDPLERAVEAVVADVENGYVTATARPRRLRRRDRRRRRRPGRHGGAANGAARGPPWLSRRRPRCRSIVSRSSGVPPRSREAWAAALGVLPAGVSGAAKYYSPYPVFLASGDGGHVHDVDGNEYVDLLMGAGSILLGHCDSRIATAVAAQMSQLGTALAPTALERTYAERLRAHMPYLERLRFANTGSEANRSRAARAYTGRTRYGKFEGNYHGSDDCFLFSSVSPLHTRADRGGPSPSSTPTECRRV